MAQKNCFEDHKENKHVKSVEFDIYFPWKPTVSDVNFKS